MLTWRPGSRTSLRCSTPPGLGGPSTGLLRRRVVVRASAEPARPRHRMRGSVSLVQATASARAIFACKTQKVRRCGDRRAVASAPRRLGLTCESYLWIVPAPAIACNNGLRATRPLGLFKGRGGRFRPGVRVQTVGEVLAGGGLDRMMPPVGARERADRTRAASGGGGEEQSGGGLLKVSGLNLVVSVLSVRRQV